MKILVLDDQRSARRVLRNLLADERTEVLEAATAAEASEIVERERPDLLLVDIRLSDDVRDRSGIAFIETLRRAGVSTPVVVVTVLSEFAEVRHAMRAGAQDFLMKDELSAESVRPVIDNVRQRVALKRKVEALTAQLHRERGVDSLIGRSPAMQALRILVGRAAESGVPVLLTGETGTGKERVARALHVESSRRGEPFVAVNCAALPSTLAESLLFGHERGAFTGAERRHRGAFEEAGRGTILLDEVGDMPIEIQSKLLRVLEERQFQPLGSERILKSEARVVAATNVDLEERVRAGRFRSDLLYRLNVIEMHLPSLSERREDIPELIRHFVQEASERLQLTDATFEWFARRPWPGNVRELRNAVERVVALCDAETVDIADVERLFAPIDDVDRTRRLRRLVHEILSLIPDRAGPKVREVERAIIHHAIEIAAGNKSQAARLLNTPRTSFDRKLESLQRADSDGDGDAA